MLRPLLFIQLAIGEGGVLGRVLPGTGTLSTVQAFIYNEVAVQVAIAICTS